MGFRRLDIHFVIVPSFGNIDIMEDCVSELLLIVSKLIDIKIVLLKISGEGARNLFIQYLISFDFFYPWVTHYLFDPNVRTQSKPRIFMKKSWEQILRIFWQVNISRETKLLSNDSLFQHLLIFAIKGRKPSDQLIQQCSKRIIINCERMACFHDHFRGHIFGRTTIRKGFLARWFQFLR